MSSMSDHKGPAVLQLPARDGLGGKHSIPCELEGMQGKRLILSATEYITESTAVSVEYEDTLFLGEVVVSSESGENWRLEILVEQMLNGLQSLMVLRAHLMSESMSAQVASFPVGMRN